MASTNTHHPPAGQPAPATFTSAPSWGTVIFSLTIFTLVGLMIVLFYMIFHHPHAPAQPFPPIVNLYSFTATTLSNTTNAMWILNLSVSNPNTKGTIYLQRFTVKLYYNNHSNNISKILVFVGANEGKFIQTLNGYNYYSSNVTFSTGDLGGKDVISRFLGDQKKGSIGITIMAMYFMNFKKNDEYWKMMNIICAGVSIHFEKPSANKTVLGFASPLPGEFQIYNP